MAGSDVENENKYMFVQLDDGVHLVKCNGQKSKEQQAGSAVWHDGPIKNSKIPNESWNDVPIKIVNSFSTSTDGTLEKAHEDQVADEEEVNVMEDENRSVKRSYSSSSSSSEDDMLSNVPMLKLSDIASLSRLSKLMKRRKLDSKSIPSVYLNNKTPLLIRKQPYVSHKHSYNQYQHKLSESPRMKYGLDNRKMLYKSQKVYESPKPCSCSKSLSEEQEWRTHIDRELASVQKQLGQVLQLLKKKDTTSSNPVTVGKDDEENGVTEYDVFKYLPLKSNADLVIVEQKVVDDEAFKQKMISLLAQTGGNTVKKTITRMLTRLFADELALQYSWVGFKGKKALSTSPLMKVLFAAIRRNYKNATDFDIIKDIKRWVVHAPYRAKRHSKESSMDEVEKELAEMNE